MRASLRPALLLATLQLSAPALAGPREEREAERIKSCQEGLAELEASEAFGYKRGRLHEKIGDAERKRGHVKAARMAYRAALDAYASGGSVKSRNRLLGRLRKPGRNWTRKAAAAFNEIRDSWRTLPKLRRRAAKLRRHAEPPERPDKRLQKLREQTAGLRAVAKRWDDTDLQANLLAIEGRLDAASGDPAAEIRRLREGARLCAKERCPPTRRRLLTLAARRLERAGDPEEAFRIFVRLNAEANERLPEEQRRYARSRHVSRVCASLRREQGAAACRTIERKVAGYVTFHDFSRGKPRSGLTEAKIKAVHDEYLHLMSACLIASVRRKEAVPGERYELAWTIRNDGRADNLECEPDVEGDKLDACFREALTWFRYPRYLGERSNIIIPLAVND